MTSLMRVRREGEHAKVGFVELFSRILGEENAGVVVWSSGAAEAVSG
ncbi:hypothetical protein U0030_06605 [Brevundimonas bullata]|nr:hypothetical protein [Brevundimonas bullata]WQE38132.1 hypothetical protein U0030_06605 [Brevundimonas bullata]